MVGVMLVLGGHVIFDGTLHGVHRLSRCDTGAVADPEDMGVDRLGGMFPPHVEHDIGRLAAHARQRLERRPAARYLAVVVLHEDLAQLHDILGLLPIKADGLDVLRQALQP